MPPQEVVETKHAAGNDFLFRRDLGKTIPRNPEPVTQEQPSFASLAKTAYRKTAPTNSETQGLTKPASETNGFIGAPITAANKESLQTTRIAAPGLPLGRGKTRDAQKGNKYKAAADQISGLAQTSEDNPPAPTRSAVLETNESLQRPEPIFRYEPQKVITKPGPDSSLELHNQLKPLQRTDELSLASRINKAPRDILKPPRRPAATSWPAANQTTAGREAPRIEIGTVEVRVTEPHKPAPRNKVAKPVGRTLAKGLAVPFGIGQA